MSKVIIKNRLLLSLTLIVCLAFLAMFYLIEKSFSFGFSHEAGFYDSDFYLRIYKPIYSDVFYTLDGSVPTEKSIRYTGPIHIVDATENPNVYSNTLEDTIFSLEEHCLGGTDQYCFPSAPKENVDKCTIIRAICIYDDGTVSDEIVSSYFVGFGNKTGYDGLMIASLISDPEGIFGYENGINVKGVAFDQNDFELNTEWQDFDANYNKRGYEWERETYLQLFDVERNCVLTQNCGIRVHGKSSRNYNVKSYNLYARKEYDGNEIFPYDFWNTGYYPDSLVLYGCGQDTRSMVRDKMICDLTKELNFARCNFLPCIIFLDGEYWGIRYICEKTDEDFFYHYYGIDKKDILELKYKQDNPLELGNISLDNPRFDDYAVCLMGKNTDSMSIELFNNTFDRNSMIDYFAVMVYIARRVDWPIYNVAYFASNSKGAGNADGKWRAILYDLYSASAEEGLIEFESLGYISERYPLFEFLMEDEKFKKELFDRIDYIDTVCFSDECVDAYLDDYVAEMSGALEKHFKRFYGDNITMEDFRCDIESIRTFFRNRGDYIRRTR